MTGRLYLKEQAAAGSDSAAYGQLVVKTDNKLYFRNDAGTEFLLNGFSMKPTTTLFAASFAIAPVGEPWGNIAVNTGNITNVTNTWYDTLNLSGQGIITSLTLAVTSSKTDSYQCRVVVDGVEVYLSTAAAAPASGTGWCLVGTSDYSATYGLVAGNAGILHYTSSMVVQIRRTTGTTQTSVWRTTYQGRNVS